MITKAIPPQLSGSYFRRATPSVFNDKALT
jgi:hypothetical protein